MSTLRNEQIEEKLQDLAGWKRKDAKTLGKIYTFDQFLTGISFVDELSKYAEEVQHHPKIIIDHTDITVHLSTHDEGGITEKDTDAAQKFNSLYDQIQQ
ncbi:4a-hydroxytetrahydrobiopterin dehydratase [Alteribacillus sp. HJP-4]|uniref:4a-hydroxytetrahydrobiopterin dehydratase n=1 Tax=Alteribacillus sp. HJP-4 TaxID=2775394 RepID=UPI0035CD0974